LAVRIRLKRMGRKKRPFYRIAVFDSRSQRDGKAIEEIGTYNPLEQDESKMVTLNRERAEYWLSVGAKPTQPVAAIFRNQGIKIPAGKA